MKLTLQISIFDRSVPSWAAAFLAVCLGVVPAAAQATSGIAPDRGTESPSANGVNSGVNDDVLPRRSAAGTLNDTRSTAETAERGTLRAGGDDASLKRSDRRFISEAAEDNQKEIAISQMAAERADNPEVRSYAQQIASDHYKMTQELVQLAQRKNVQLENAAALTSGAMSDAYRSVDASRSMSGSGVTDSTNAGVASTHGAPRATGSSSTASTPAATGMPTSDSTSTSGSRSGAMTAQTNTPISEEIKTDRKYRSLSEKEGAEFDKSYVSMMVDQHQADVKLFERAAREAEDQEVRQFASEHLASLQQHLQRAKNLTETAAAE